MIAVALGLPAHALADPASEAKQHRDRAAVAYGEKRYGDVLAELQQAYALEPDPQLNFSIGQVYMKLGRCTEAIASYDRFMATGPSAERAETTRQAIASCKARPIKPADPTPPAIVAGSNPPPDSSWHDDHLLVGLVAGGAALTLVGLLFYASGRSQLADAAHAPTYGSQVEQYDGATTKRDISVVCLLGGLAGLGVGGYRYFSREPGVAIAPTGSGAVLTWTTGF